MSESFGSLRNREIRFQTMGYVGTIQGRVHGTVILPYKHEYLSISHFAWQDLVNRT